jgi:Zn finger protein HypA/HybF involved in hydrogenase expression
MPVHGDRRNNRYEQTEKVAEYHLPDGKVAKVPYISIEQSVSERYCEKCGDWVEAKGVMGALFCPVCKSTWNKKYWTEEAP